MSREKQIEEMAKVIKSSLDGLGCGNFNFTGDEISTMFAKALYEKGCCKQIEAENMAMYPTSAFECSLCGWSNWDLATGDGTYKYCPNCGAKMKGDSDIELWTFTVWDDNGLTKSFTKTVKKGGVE